MWSSNSLGAFKRQIEGQGGWPWVSRKAQVNDKRENDHIPFLQDDGNVVIKSRRMQVLWASDTYRAGLPGGPAVAAPVPTPSRRKNVDRLESGAVLEYGDNVTSLNGKYKFIFQNDGNFVLYAGDRVLYASDTVGKGGAKVIMQDDGNLVMYARDGRVP